MLDAVKVLSEPATWGALKRALKTGKLGIESLPQVLGWPGTSTLEPQPIALHVKVVLFGERAHYYLLQELDPEFPDLFTIAADFDDEVDNNPENRHRWAQLIARITRVHGIFPVDRGALLRLAEFSARIAGDAQKLSTQTRPLMAVLQEAQAAAISSQCTAIGAQQIEAALVAQRQRANRQREVLQEAFSRRHLLIDCEGWHIGQVNGLAVAEIGSLRFGYPVRVSATTRLGDGDVIDIEREATLGGPIHSKGILILVGFLAGRYAQALPLSMHASLVFEQSYGAVEGDSASLAEACALLSSLSMLGVRQDLAVTGSMNQFGQIQPVGGVDEKIEGFFDLCQLRGLSGSQGVLIPRAHVGQLVLKREVVQAAAQGQFHIYPVETIDQAMALLTGVEAGQLDAKGDVAAGTVNHRVATRLFQLSVLRSAWSTGTALQPRGMPRKRPHHLRPIRSSR
jgi:predicted ATP-dependent protease